MNFRVVWATDLAHRLEQHAFVAHESGRDAAAITDAAERISLTLSDDPVAAGESRAGAERVLVDHPLTVVYEPFPDNRVVIVYEAVIYPGRRV